MRWPTLKMGTRQARSLSMCPESSQILESFVAKVRPALAGTTPRPMTSRSLRLPLGFLAWDRCDRGSEP